MTRPPILYPTPWRVTECQRSHGEALVLESASGTVIARTPMPKTKLDYIHMTLLAASPDMLAFLQDLALLMAHNHGPKHLKHEMQARLPQLTNLLLKATWRKP